MASMRQMNEMLMRSLLTQLGLGDAISGTVTVTTSETDYTTDHRTKKRVYDKIVTFDALEVKNGQAHVVKMGVHITGPLTRTVT